MSLTVKIQQYKVKYTSGRDVAPIVDITDRVDISTIRSFKERMESGRFAFTASDIDIEITNFDDFISVGSDYVDVGTITYIYWDGVELFRGISLYNDFSFEDAPIKTVKWRSKDWLKRLRDATVTNWESPMTLTELNTELTRLIRQEVSGIPRFSDPVLDFSGVLPIEFDVEMGQEEPLDGWNYDDVWRDPRTSRIYAVRYNPDTGDDGSIDLYRPKGNRHELLRSWPISVVGVTFDEIVGTGFVRSVCTTQNILTIYFIYYYVDVDGRRSSHSVRRAYSVNLDDLTIAESYAFSESVRNIYMTGISAPINAGSSVCSDGQYLYMRKEESDGTIYIEKYTQSRTYIGRADLTPQPNSLTAIDAPYLNTIVYHNGTRWYWFRWPNMGDFAGSISAGETLPDRNYTSIYPTGYEQNEYMGKYHYYVWRDLPGVLDLDEWWTNDPIFIILSALYYEETTIEDILTDLAQFFNAYFVHRNGVVYMYNRGSYANNIEVSTDYIHNSRYNRNLRDDTKDEPYLELKALGVSDDSDNPYNTRTLAGALRSYYRTIAQAKWIARSLTLPLTVGKDIRLGDNITVREAGVSGVVLERGLSLGKGDKSAEFLIEYEDTT